MELLPKVETRIKLRHLMSQHNILNHDVARILNVPISTVASWRGSPEAGWSRIMPDNLLELLELKLAGHAIR